MSDEKVLLEFNVNGEECELEVRPNKSLLDVLRNDLDLKSVRYGCGRGECGACTVLVDGKPVTSCLVLAPDVHDSEIVTIEGISDNGELHPIQEAFIEAGGFQCGYCTPGMIISTKYLLDNDPTPSEEKIKEYLKGNLCRCTGYKKIVEAVQLASKKLGEKNE